MSSSQEGTIDRIAERQPSSSEGQNAYINPQKETKKRKNSKSLEVLLGCFGLRRFKFLRLSSFKKTHDSASCSSSRQQNNNNNNNGDPYDVIPCDVIEDVDAVRRSGSESVAVFGKREPNQLPTKSHSLHHNMQGAGGSDDALMMGNGAVAGGGGADGHWQALFDEWTFNREIWRVKTRFQSLKAVNGGAFGFVCSAFDTLTNTEVAIKRMNQPFKSEIHAKRALRELKLLRFAQHDNLISLVDAYTTAVSAQSMVDLYLVMPLLDTDLHQLIQQFKQSDQHILSQDYIHFFMYQMLRGLKYLHSANIMHRDLKPSNIAIKTDCSLKIIDFGLCRKANKEVTGYVQTRWYRAPEVMIDWKHYTSAVDLWSLGCILGEMLLARPVFKEDDHVELLKKHIYICGTPDEQTLQSYESEQAVTFIRERLSGQPRVNFLDYFKGTGPCTDLLERLLQMNPRDRLTAEQALSHPYFSQLHDPVDEKEASGIFDDSFEDIATTPELKQAIFDEVSHIAIHGPHWNGLPAGSRP